MNKFGAGVLGALIGVTAVAVGGAVLIDEVAHKVKLRTQYLDGYSVSLMFLPAVVGLNQPIVALVQYGGNPLPNVPVALTVQSNSGKDTLTAYTDANGAAQFNLLTFTRETVQVSAEYVTPQGGKVTDRVHMRFSTEPLMIPQQVAIKKG